MTRTAKLLLLIPFWVPRSSLGGQGLDPALLTKPATDSWPTYAGDSPQRRYRTLTQIDTTNVRHLSLAWVSRLTAGAGGEGGFFGPAAVPAVTGGVAENPVNTPGSTSGTPRLAGSILQVNGILYISSADNAWAMDALGGHILWHYWWKSRGGTHIGNRGMGMYGNWLFFETPDNYLVSLDATTGKERWHKVIADVKQEYFSTPAPLIIRNHVIVGLGGDSLDVPGWLESRDPETGDIQWKWNTTPRPGEPGSESWPDAYSMEHGGGMPWQPPTYDPDLNLLYVPTGNPNPVMAGQSRNGNNLWTASIVALNPDTGKLVWYFQCSPHDTHDWDATQVPILFDDVMNGRPRKLLAQVSRNGFFFVLDRTNGQNLLSKPYLESDNWYKGIDA